MRQLMKGISWLVFLAFVGLSGFANWEHGTTQHAKFMLAVMPVGFAASIFILEAVISHGKATAWHFAMILPVTLCSGIASYIGLYGMARANAIGPFQAGLMPLAFDGVVLVASMGIRAFSLTEAPKMSRPRVRRDPVPVTQGVPASVPADVPAKVSRPRKEWDRDKARQLLAEGMSHKDVAELVGVSRKSIDRLASEGQDG